MQFSGGYPLMLAPRAIEPSPFFPTKDIMKIEIIHREIEFRYRVRFRLVLSGPIKLQAAEHCRRLSLLRFPSIFQFSWGASG
jgi:hypothetical protein